MNLTAIPGCDNYHIELNGNAYVWSTRRKNGKGGVPRRLYVHIDSDGYRTVKIHVNGKRKYFKIARLVLITFKNKPTPKCNDASHVDGNRCCDLPHNLEWKTHKANMKDIIRHRRMRKQILDMFESHTVGPDWNDNNITPF